MSPTVTTQLERLAFDGPLHLTAVAMVGAAIAALFAWSLRRERSALGLPNAVLFWLLRTAALGVALWMLLAPSTVRSQRSTTRKAIVVAVDVSRSMQTADSPERVEDLRWALAARGETAQLLAASDRALAASTLAELRLGDAVSALKNERPEQQALAAAAAAHAAILRTKTHVRSVVERLAAADLNNQTQPDLAAPREQTDRVLKLLDGSEFRNLATIAAAANSGKDSLNSDWRESLADIGQQAAAVRRRLAELSQRFGELDAAALFSLGGERVETSETTRLARTARVIASLDAEVLQPLGEQVEVRYATFDSELFPLDGQEFAAAELARFAEPAGATAKQDEAQSDDDVPVTDLSAALQQLRQMALEQPLAAAFLFTDAAHNRAGARDPRQAAAELAGTPVYVVPIGATLRARDVELKSVSAPGVVMKDDDVVIEAAIEAYQCQGEFLHVELLRDGAVIQDRQLELDSGQTLRRVRFNAQLPDVGLARLQLRLAPLEGELSEENNFDQFEINVTRNHIDLLLADEMPRWEYRYLAQLFRRDEKVACDELLFRPRLISTGRREASQGLPATADEWDDYDVVLLGDLPSARLPAASQRSLTEFVRERGGTLVVIAGDEFMPQDYADQPLAELLPVMKLDAADAAAVDGYAFHVTDEGWRHHALMIADTEESTKIAWDFINRHAPLSSLSQYRQPRPSARTLIAAVSRISLDPAQDAANSALLAWQPVGRGRVVYLASPETYRLRFLHGDRLHYRFWGQLLRWAIADELAVGSQLVGIRADRSDYLNGQSVQVAVQLKDEAGQPVAGAQIEAAAIGALDRHTTVPLSPDEAIPGRYVGAFERLPSGIYRVEPRGAETERLLAPAGGEAPNVPATSFTVRESVNRELVDTRSDRALARQIAEATGGLLLPPTAVGEVLALTDLKPFVTEHVETLPLWVEWKFLWIVFGCLFAEWLVRKRLGLS